MENPSQLPLDVSGMTPEQILLALDSGWPWPLDAVQEWFEDLWDMILEYFHKVVDWVVDKVKPIIDSVWDWIQSAIDWITSNVGGLIDSVWDWIQSAADWVVEGVRSLLASVWDWLESVKTWLWEHIQAGWSAFTTTIRGWWTSFTTTIKGWWDSFASTIRGWWDTVTANLKSWWDSFTRELQLSWEAFKTDIVVPIQAVMNTWWTSFINTLLDFPSWVGKLFDTVWAWLMVDIPGHSPQGKVITQSLLGWIVTYISFYFDDFMKWLFRNIGAAIAIIITPALGLVSTLVQSLLPAIGQALVPFGDLIHHFVTPIFEQLFTWAEGMGPVAPGSGFTQKESLTKLLEFTLSGLGAMTLAGESIGFWKHLGMGHISAMIYDLSNYKMLTAAFVGVLAAVYVRKPLEYYYNRIARPELPNERALTDLVTHRAITPERFAETMAYHGYPDEWITLLHKVAYRPLTPYLLRSLAEAGEVDDAFIQRVLEDAEYADADIPFIKDHMRRLAAGELKALMVGVALKRYREGLDDQAVLSQNLLALGVNPSLMDKYLFGAELDALTDYQLDLLAYYKDAYHRREINDQQFLEALDSIPLDPSRSSLIYNREKIKRLKVASTPTVAVKTLSAAQIGALYKLGALDRDDAIGRLSTYLPIVGDRQLFLKLYEPGAPAVPAG